MTDFDNLLIWAMDHLDAGWFFLLPLILRKGQRIWALGFVVANMVMMRMLMDLMAEFGYPHGVLGMWDASFYLRGLWVYSGVYLLYAALLNLFPATTGVFLIATSISMFFTASAIFAGIMVL